MQDMTLHSQHLDWWCEDTDDHRPFTTITFQLMMTNDHAHDGDYEIEEDESEKKGVAVVHCCTRLSVT